MNKRFVGVLIFAFIVALGISTVFYRLLVHQSETAKAAASSVRIALAAKDLEVGRILREDDIKIADWPGEVPAGATTRPQDLVGRGVTTAIYAKEPMIESRLAPKGAGGGLAAMIFMYLRSLNPRIRFGGHRSAPHVEMLSYYWHFVDVVWIALYGMIFLLPSTK